MLIPSFEHLPFYFVPGSALGTGDFKISKKRFLFLRVLSRVWGKRSINKCCQCSDKTMFRVQGGWSVTEVSERCWERLSGGETLI